MSWPLDGRLVQEAAQYRLTLQARQLSTIYIPLPVQRPWPGRRPHAADGKTDAAGGRPGARSAPAHHFHVRDERSLGGSANGPPVMDTSSSSRSSQGTRTSALEPRTGSHPARSRHAPRGRCRGPTPASPLRSSAGVLLAPRNPVPARSAVHTRPMGRTGTRKGEAHAPRR